MFKSLIRHQAPMLAKDMSKSIELLLDETAEKNAVPPFELHILFKNHDKESVGLVHQDERLLCTVQIKKMIVEIFDENMKRLPALMKNQVIKMMDGKSVDAMITEMLQEGTLLAKYNLDDELEYYIMKEEKEEKINLEDFFSSL